MDIDAGGTYRPQTRDTQAAYEALLSVVQDKLGDYATDVIAGAADEVLGILKSDTLKVSTGSLHSAFRARNRNDSLTSHGDTCAPAESQTHFVTPMMVKQPEVLSSCKLADSSQLSTFS